MRKIAVVTTSRADYSHLYWVLRALRDHPVVDLRLIVTAAHLSAEFGRSVDAIEADGFRVDERVECLLSSDSDVGMAKTIGLATLGFAEVLDRMRPDLMLLIADRYEMLAPASVGLSLRLPMAHIEGGEISEGAIDDAVRNALTKLCHLHFTPTEAARQRVLALGEEAWRVHHSGAPSLDHLVKSDLPRGESLAQALDGPIEPGTTLVVYHPVTLARDTLREVDELYVALERIDGPLAFCFPNADAGSRQLIERARALCERRGGRLFVNLRPTVYWGLLHEIDVMVGNSSSGIMETPSLRLPTVNIGFRQQGRERAANIIDVEPRAEAIHAGWLRARDAGFKQGLAGMRNPYGDGRAAETIVDVLSSVELGERLLHKRPIELASAPSAG